MMDMDQQSSQPTTQSTIVYDFDGSVVMKQEPQNDFSQLDVMDDCGLNINVINIAPIIDNKTKLCKLEDLPSIKQEIHEEWCELYDTSHQLAVKVENDLDICDCKEELKFVNRDVSLKTKILRSDDSSSQLVEVPGAIDCKDGIVSNITAGICVGRVNQSDEEQSDAAQQQPPGHLESTDEIKTEGM